MSEVPGQPLAGGLPGGRALEADHMQISWTNQKTLEVGSGLASKVLVFFSRFYQPAARHKKLGDLGDCKTLNIFLRPPWQ